MKELKNRFKDFCIFASAGWVVSFQLIKEQKINILLIPILLLYSITFSFAAITCFFQPSIASIFDKIDKQQKK